MSTTTNVETFSQAYPSVELAYQIAVHSYDVLMERLESVDGRLQTMLALFATITAAVPAVAAGKGLSFHSKWFYAAMISMAFAVVIAAVARWMGEFRVLDPSKLDTDKWLECSEWEFQNYMIQAAGKAFKENDRLITRKWRCGVVVSVIFFLGAGCVVLWVSGAAT